MSNVVPEHVSFEAVPGIALPGFQNTHSHAFQYAMAGIAEVHSENSSDDFWSWREAMYQTALAVNPDQVEAIATMLYAEMLRNGYTHVVEFHYLHHDQQGRPYSDIAEMGGRLISAARKAGIGITLVPVFYQQGGFGLPPQERQRRFIQPDIDSYLLLLDQSRRHLSTYERATLGMSVHSLRAVRLPDITRTFEMGPSDIPFHLHLSEQLKEVSDCVQYCGARPAQWLLENLPVSPRFNLVHCTHLDDNELRGIAASGAQVVLCPSTEGSLGDGIFRMREYAGLKGQWTIGTDSHILLNPLEELRMIDYQQRLLSHQRNTFSGEAARHMIEMALVAGYRSAGLPQQSSFEIGSRLDAIVYHSQSHLLQTTSEKHLLSCLVYTADSSKALGTIVQGQWVVQSGIHRNGHSIKEDFLRAVRALDLR